MTGTYFTTKKWVSLSLLFILALAIKLLSLNKEWVEESYYAYWYPGIGKTLRTLFGWLPFSLGDLIYAALSIWIIYHIILFLKNIFQKRIKKHETLIIIYKMIFTALIVYIIFYSLWGMNYSRKGVAWQLQLELKDYNKNDLILLDSLLISRANFYKNEVIRRGTRSLPYKTIFDRAYLAYDNARLSYPYLDYQNRRSLKPVLLGSLMSRLGFMGHYNPFTGEAQVNTDVPNFMLPFTTCHEIAHQLGYAKENEANFVGYLAAQHSKDPYFLYSTYLDLYFYANGELFRMDSAKARQSRAQLNGYILQDLEEWKRYKETHRSPFEPIAEKFYASFLKMNEQPAGIRSYNRVVLWLMAYYKKQGTL
jgi:hypothetical protein